jgi:subtilisin family serine protease
MSDRAAPPPRALVLPGKVVVRLGSRRGLEHIASHRDVRTGRAPAAHRFDFGGALDRTIARYSPGLQVARHYVARRHALDPGRRQLDWDGVEERLGISRTYRLAVDPAADVRALVQDLAALDDVEMAAPELACEMPLAVAAPVRRIAGPDPLAMIGAARALQAEPGDGALIVGLVDTGVDLAHPELTGRLRPGLNSVTATDLAGQVTLLSGPRARVQDIADDHGHGTECSGLLVGRGVEIPRGLAGDSPLLAVRALCGARIGPGGAVTAIGSLADIDSGLKTCIDLGARVVNCSFGTPETALEDYGYVPHVDMVRYAEEHDCVLVVASGNNGDFVRFYPAALPGVLAVGSVGADRRPSRFTSRGAHVVVCAPGEEIPVATVGERYARASGTSFAAPLVTAACALMRARAARASAALSTATLRRILTETASPFATGADVAGCGAGVLDVPAALAAVDEACAATAGEREAVTTAPAATRRRIA